MHLNFTMIYGKNLFMKNNFTRINHCKFIHHKSHLKPLLSYLPCIVHREYLSIIFNVKKERTILNKIRYLLLQLAIVIWGDRKFFILKSHGLVKLPHPNCLCIWALRYWFAIYLCGSVGIFGFTKTYYILCFSNKICWANFLTLDSVFNRKVQVVVSHFWYLCFFVQTTDISRTWAGLLNHRHL